MYHEYKYHMTILCIDFNNHGMFQEHYSGNKCIDKEMVKADAIQAWDAFSFRIAADNEEIQQCFYEMYIDRFYLSISVHHANVYIETWIG